MAEKYDPTRPVEFRRGVYRLNDEPHIDFQLNRLVNWDGGDLDEVRAVGPGIKTFDDYTRELRALGRAAEEAGRTRAAFGYYLMGDFYDSWDDPDKLPCYHHAQELFYDYYEELFSPSDGSVPVVERLSVPYENGATLPAFHVTPDSPSRGTILLHGGNDSYMEEFLPVVLYFREHGYEVYLYEGPGQGSVIRDQGIPFTHEWERTTRPFTEGLGLHDVTIVGISLGGYFAPRAAAFDKRISRVVGWSIYPGTYELVEGGFGRGVLDFFKAMLAVRFLDGAINGLYERNAAKGDLSALSMLGMCHTYGASSYCDLYRKMGDYTLRNCADKVDQDMLILGADEDIYVVPSLAGMELDELKNTKSLELRMFKAAEGAGNHCNVGDVKLALDTILDWMHRLDVRDSLAHGEAGRGA